jgi:hypothetical protein
LKSSILIVSFAKDLPFFEVCARSVGKYARGFDRVKVLVPTQDVEAFKLRAEPQGIEVAGWDEMPGKGFLDHMRMKCYADQHLPDADVIFHLDSDSVFARPCTPGDWIEGGKVLLPYTDFKEFLTVPLKPDEEKNFMGFTGRTIDFNRGQYFWKFASDFALGWDVTRETMAWMPLAHVREVYPKLRSVIEARHKVSFDEYVFGCRNEFPQTFCEFNALGAIAHKFFEERYEWRDIHRHGHKFLGKVIQSYSHNGLHHPHDYGSECGGVQTPCELFKRLGLND